MNIIYAMSVMAFLILMMVLVVQIRKLIDELDPSKLEGKA